MMPRPPRFTWRTADGSEHSFDVTASEISIGRAPTCDIILADDQMVSRRHAVMRRQGIACTLVDLGSSNGTLVNGIEIRDATLLKESDRVTIGDQDLIFYAGQEATDFATPDMVTVATAGPAQSYGQAPAWSPPPMEPFAPPVVASPPPAAVANGIVEADTGALGVVAGEQSSFQHYHNGQLVESDSTAGSYQYQQNYDYGNYYGGQPAWQGSSGSQAPAPPPAASVPPSAAFSPPPAAQQPPISGPARQDAQALLIGIESQLAQLKEQVSSANGASDQIRDNVRIALNQLEMALRNAQTTSQQSALADLQQMAGSVSQTPMIDQAAAFARRAGEIRDVLAAHQDLLAALASVRQQLDRAVNG